MKKLLLLICLLPLFAQAQFTNQTVSKTIATGTLSTNPGLDTIPRVTGVLTNGYVLMFNSSLNKWYAVDPSTFSPSLSVSTVSPGGYANGLNYAAGVFRLGKVSATNPGVLTTGTDTIAGNKRFTGVLYSDRVGQLYENTTVGTDNRIFNISNTSGNLKWGVTGSAGTFWTGSTPYSGTFGTNTATSFDIATNNTVRYNISSGGNHDFKAGTITTSSLTTGSVYSSSGTLTNTAPTSGTIGYWSRNSGTGTLTTATGTDAVTLGGALTGTTATFSGTITSTRTSGAILNAVSSTTGSPFVNFQSTSGQLLTGIEASAGGSIATGSTAYSTFFGNQVAKPIDFFTNGVVRYTIDATGNNTWTGGGSFGGAVLVNNNDITQDGTRPILTMRQSGTTKLLVGIADSGDDFITGTVSGDVAYRKNGGNFLWSVDNGSTAALKIASDNTVRAPTPSPNDNSTKVATTAYVDNAAYSGTYTPTPSNEVNIASLTVNQFMYSRVGNVVTGSGDINIDPTAASQVQVRLTLPIASNFTSTVDANGGLFGYEQNGSDLKADPTNDAFTLSYEATATNLRTMKVWFQYIVK